MKAPKVILYLIVVFVQELLISANSVTTRTQSSVIQTADAGPNNNRDVSASSVLGSMYRKSRQSRCVRCYEDRYGYDDRSRGGYSSRSAEDRNWYYPSYDYDRSSYSSYYRDRDDRYSSRSYDRYEPRGDRYGDRYGGDRYGDRYGSDRYGDRYGSDRYGDRYGDSYRDRYYDRSRQGGDRDYYDRYYQRYDYRNYRPFDETYRGQSGFDNSGRGYYFAGDENRDANSRRYLPETSRRCGILITNCPYDRNNDNAGGGGGGAGGMRPPYRPSDSGDNRNNGSNTNRPGGWSYMNEQDSQNHHNGNSGNNAGGSSASSSSNNNNNNAVDRDRDRNQQSSSYGGRPPRPLGGSYLFDRDSNEVNAAGQTANAKPGSEVGSNQQAQQGVTGAANGNAQALTMLTANEVNKQ